MDLVTYLTDPAVEFGAPAWAFLIIDVVVALVGGYLAVVRADTHAIRGPALRRLGYAMLAAGAVGAMLGILRLAGVPPFTMRLWLYVVALFELALAAYAIFYARVSYPARLASMAQAGRSRAPRSSLSSNANGQGVVPDQQPRPLVPSSRRESRRERKRRSR